MNEFKEALKMLEFAVKQSRSDMFYEATKLIDLHEKTIRKALRIAEALEGGEVSHAMCRIYMENQSEFSEELGYRVAIPEKAFKAMAKQLIKECE